jgi:hypothetical protein
LLSGEQAFVLERRREDKTMNTTTGLAALSLAMFLSACGGTDATEWADTDSEWEPLNESSCLTATYSNPGCSKSWISTIPFLRSQETFGALWTDRWGRNRTQCEGGSLTVRVMSRTTTQPIPVFYRNEGTFTAPLRFAADTGVCYYPKFSYQGFGTGVFEYIAANVEHEPRPDPFPFFFVQMSNLGGRSVKLAVQALTPAGSTQSVNTLAWLPPF